MTLDAFRLSDNYSLRAQIFPAIIAGLPSLALISAMVPWDHLGLPHAIASVMVTVLLFAFADLARRCGRKVEARLGTRSTPEILFRDNALIDEPSKARYRAFLAKTMAYPHPWKMMRSATPIRRRVFIEVRPRGSEKTPGIPKDLNFFSTKLLRMDLGEIYSVLNIFLFRST